MCGLEYCYILGLPCFGTNNSRSNLVHPIFHLENVVFSGQMSKVGTIIKFQSAGKVSLENCLLSTRNTDEAALFLQFESIYSTW